MTGRNNGAVSGTGGRICRIGAGEMRNLLNGGLARPGGQYIAKMEDGFWTGFSAGEASDASSEANRFSGSFHEVIEWLIPPTGIVRNVTRERQTDWKAAVSSIVPVRIDGAQIREWTEPVRVYEIRDGGDPGEEAPAVSGEHEAQKKPAAAWRSGIAMRDARILALFREGKSWEEIGREVNLDPVYVRQRIAKMRRRDPSIPDALKEKKRRKDERILELLRSGMSREDCARELGVTADYLRKRIYVMRRRGIEVPDARDAEEERRLSARVSGMRERGFSCAEIARQVGVSMSTIYRILRVTSGEEAENEMQGG